VDVVERHLARFVVDGHLETSERAMVDRLRAAMQGRIEATPYDLRFYSHELREFVRYRRLGFDVGQPADADAANALWNNAHTAALEDYRISELVSPLYQPGVAP
jgi:hypothetical protein